MTPLSSSKATVRAALSWLGSLLLPILVVLAFAPDGCQVLAAPNPPVLLGDDLTPPPVTVTGAMRWVPPVPADPCDTALQRGLTCGDGQLHCPATVAAARAAIQNTATQGDTICLRGGTYRSPGGNAPLFTLTTRGLQLGEYPGEDVILQGRDPALARAEYNAGRNVDRNHNGLIINADNVTVQGLRFEWFGEAAITARGNNLKIIDNDFQYAYRNMVIIGYGDCCDVTSPSFSNVQVWFNRARHSVEKTPIWGGPELGLTQPQRVDNVQFKYNLIRRAGYLPNDNVEPRGGGDADALSSFKSCSDSVVGGGTDNYCNDWDVSWNLGQHMTDGHLDFSVGSLRAVGNALIDPGPPDVGNVVGIKFLRATPGDSVIGNNLIHGGGHMNRGLESRNQSRRVSLVNNGFLYGANGLHVFSPAGGNIVNNVLVDTGIGFRNVGGARVSHNAQYRAHPGLNDCSPNRRFDFETVMQDESLTARERLVTLYSRIAAACGPSPSGIDAGTVIAGYHCARADDDSSNPYSPSDDACVHWLGAAPDQGPFEPGLY